MQIRVLFISFDGLSDPLGQSQILPYLCGLASRDISITILSLEKKYRYEKQKNQLLQKCRSKNIDWVPLPYSTGIPVFSQIANARKLIRHAERLQQEKSFSIAHCRSYISALAGLKLKTKYNVKFLFDMRGFWADERIEGGIWNTHNPIYFAIYKFFKRKESEFLTRADHVVSLTFNAKREIESWPIKCAPITIIPTCVDMDLFDPKTITVETLEMTRRLLGISENEKVLLYLGSWGSWYLTNDMLQLFQQLKLKGIVSRFLIVTMDQVDLSGIANPTDVIVRPVPRTEVPIYISLATLAVCMVKPTFSKKASSATKVGEIMAMNVPIIINAGWGDVDMLYNSFPEHVKLINSPSENFTNFVPKPSVDVRSQLKEQLSLEGGIDAYKKIYQLMMI
jgi:glycosyltransferase involved in cell wall biosynthesis